MDGIRNILVYDIEYCFKCLSMLHNAYEKVSATIIYMFFDV